MPFVLDASVTAAWLLPDETDPLIERVLDMLAVDQALVPRIWWFEIHNLLLMSERRGRLLAIDTQAILASLAKYPILADDAPDEIEVLRLARDYYMTFYDASYVELALRRELPIATLDRRMANAAAAEFVGQVTRSGH
jgi:predicted nucleic acid-binding protein